PRSASESAWSRSSAAGAFRPRAHRRNDQRTIVTDRSFGGTIPSDNSVLEQGGSMSRRDRLIATLGVTLGVIALASLATAADPRPRRGLSGEQGLFETRRVLDYQGNECARVP